MLSGSQLSSHQERLVFNDRCPVPTAATLCTFRTIESSEFDCDHSRAPSMSDSSRNSSGGNTQGRSFRLWGGTGVVEMTSLGNRARVVGNQRLSPILAGRPTGESCQRLVSPARSGVGNRLSPTIVFRMRHRRHGGRLEIKSGRRISRRACPVTSSHIGTPPKNGGQGVARGREGGP